MITGELFKDFTFEVLVATNSFHLIFGSFVKFGEVNRVENFSPLAPGYLYTHRPHVPHSFIIVEK